MKAYLGIRDTDVVYQPEHKGSAGKLFGIDTRERNYARIHVA
jgi:hypothetical protein